MATKKFCDVCDKELGYRRIILKDAPQIVADGVYYQVAINSRKDLPLEVCGPCIRDAFDKAYPRETKNAD